MNWINEYGEEKEHQWVNWKAKIDWKDSSTIEALTEYFILNNKYKIDNRKIIYTYHWLDYYKAIALPYSTNRKLYFDGNNINICGNKYLGQNTPINIKKEIKNKNKVIYSNFESGQIRAFYYWKKSYYPKKDVFDGFIPYGNHTFWGTDPENFIKNNDMELLRTGKLTDAFYNFNTSIPIITVEQ